MNTLHNVSEHLTSNIALTNISKIISVDFREVLRPFKAILKDTIYRYLTNTLTP